MLGPHALIYYTLRNSTQVDYEKKVSWKMTILEIDSVFTDSQGQFNLLTDVVTLKLLYVCWQIYMTVILQVPLNCIL